MHRRKINVTRLLRRFPKRLRIVRHFAFAVSTANNHDPFKTGQCLKVNLIHRHHSCCHIMAFGEAGHICSNSLSIARARAIDNAQRFTRDLLDRAVIFQRFDFDNLTRKRRITRHRINDHMVSDIINTHPWLFRGNRYACTRTMMPKSMRNTDRALHHFVSHFGGQANIANPRGDKNIAAI